MYSVVINSNAAEITTEQFRQICEICSNRNPAQPTWRERHRQVCFLLGISSYIPSPTYKPYAIRSVALEIFDGSRAVWGFGTWHECFNCHHEISLKPAGASCPSCGAKAIKNFKYEEPPKKKPFPKSKKE